MIANVAAFVIFAITVYWLARLVRWIDDPEGTHHEEI